MKTLLCSAFLSLVLLAFASPEKKTMETGTLNVSAASLPAMDTVPKKDTIRKDTIARDTFRF